MTILLGRTHIERYLQRAYGSETRLLAAGDIGNLDEQGMKGFGYGKPLLVRFVSGGEEREGVLSVMKGDKYGHQFWWDRAAILMFQYETSARLPKHVRPLGLGYVDRQGEFLPLDDPREFFIFNEKLQGHDYFLNLERVRKEGLRDEDINLASRFGEWLAEVHSTKLDDPDLYYRRVRNLLGSSECILGLIDEAYPHPYEPYSDERFAKLEKRLIDWRWRLRGYAHRLSAVHGDFHPWNVLVTDEGDFSVLDRSRGEWGEPAGDLCCMALNYLLWSLYEHPGLGGDFEKLYNAYFESYLARTGDEQVFEVMAPFIVFRTLVIASPEWYPGHPPDVRAKLFRLMENVLEEDRFNWREINRYME